MRILPDTHVLLWAKIAPRRLSIETRNFLEHPANDIYFSAASIWEVSIKFARGQSDFDVDPGILRNKLIDDGYEELPITGKHALALSGLPTIHKDPFDRILIAQATAENLLLLTADSTIARYPGPIRRV